MLWTAGWQVAAQWLGGRLDRIITDASAAGTAIVCTKREIDGFPLRLSVSCDGMQVEQPDGGSTMSLTSLQVSALAIPPGRLTAALLPPATVSLNGLPIGISWTEANARMDFGFAGIARSDVNLDALTVGAGALSLSAATAIASIDPADEGAASNIALTSEAMELAAHGIDYPPFQLDVFARVAVPPAVLLTGAFDPQRAGIDIPNLSFEIESASAKMAAAGAVAADRDGLLDGELVLTLTNIPGLQDHVATLPGDLGNMLSAAIGLAAILGEPTESGENDDARIALTFDAGAISVGGMPIAVVPPLF